MINTLLILQLLTSQVPFIDFFGGVSGTLGNGLGNGLKAYYRFDEATGNLIDSGPNALHMTVVGNPTSLAGIINNSRSTSLGGYHGFVRGQNSVFLPSAVGFTVAFWIKFQIALPLENRVLIGKGYGATVEWSWDFSIHDTGQPYLNFPITLDGYNTTGITLQTPLTGFTLNTWYCVMGRYNKSSNESWLDVRKVGGSWLQDYDNTQDRTYSSTAPICIGGWASSPTTIDTGTPAPNGTVFDEMGFWDRALTDCERDQFFNAGSARLFSQYDTLPCQ